ncbi:acyl-CoA dehydrogenase family protein [Cellulosilyticum ruminicola]|uniref:acyl-CoA dehydrogenase family protein n=1 Tax=Cellulosilyticum ruminicola TaxID=425254 RepID=UPI0006CF5456|nr:acyl-CoA dehydrogenase family protein [Cellulosilyticum ruminicola]
MKSIYENPILIEAEKFVNEVLRPNASKFEEQGYIDNEVIQEMAERGFLGAILPTEYGGLGLNALDYGYFTEIIGKACCATRTLLTVHTSLVGETILKLGSSEQKERYLYDIAQGKKIGCFALSEPETGTDATAVKTTYREEEDAYVINGSKKWISFGALADIFLVIAANEKTVTAFIVEKSMQGIKVEPMKGMLAGRAAQMAHITFDEVKVPKENVLGRIGAGFNFVANTALFYGRYSIAWAGLALSERALEEMVTYSRKREQFGKKIGEFQLVREMIADAVTKVHAARSLCIHVGQLRNENHRDQVMETNVAKYYTSKIANQVTADAVQVFGGNGCWNEYAPERLFREAKVLEIIEGTSQVQQMMIANYGLHKYYKH